MSEVKRQLHTNSTNKMKIFNLDQHNLNKLKMPENYTNASYLHPELYTKNAKKDLDKHMKELDNMS
jgi:hypothetical protein